MRILGIDPGYAIVGFGALEADGSSLSALRHGAITTQAHAPFEDRLLEVYTDLCTLMKEISPNALAVESLFYTTNQKTAIAVAEARGVILLAARQAEVPIFEYTPLQVKQSVAGFGRASKKQMQEMTRRLLNLAEIPRPDDAADALALAICHAHSFNSRYSRAKTKREQMGYY